MNIEQRNEFALKLNEYKNHPNGLELLARLENWEQLDEIRKTLLRDDIEEYLRSQEKVRHTLNFMMRAANTFPSSETTHILLGLSFIVVPIAFYFTLPFQWYWSLSLAAITVVAFIILALMIESSLVKRWARKRLFTMINENDIDIDGFIQLAAIFSDKKNKEVESKNESFHNMCNAYSTIYPVLQKERFKNT